MGLSWLSWWLRYFFTAASVLPGSTWCRLTLMGAELKRRAVCTCSLHGSWSRCFAWFPCTICGAAATFSPQPPTHLASLPPSLACEWSDVLLRWMVALLLQRSCGLILAILVASILFHSCISAPWIHVVSHYFDGCWAKKKSGVHLFSPWQLITMFCMYINIPIYLYIFLSVYFISFQIHIHMYLRMHTQYRF